MHFFNRRYLSDTRAVGGNSVVAGLMLKEAICEIEVAFGVIGGKWKPLILWYLGENDVITFGQFQQLIPDITHRILTKQLRELAACGLIKRTIYPDMPVKVEYSITVKGKDVLPILGMMCNWASKNDYFGYEIKYNLCRESD
jgi:DNA-binding HxlR family transcriptional regulator